MTEQNGNTHPLEIGELAQRAALSPKILDIKSPDGAAGQCLLVPQVESGGRTSVRLESVEKFCDEYRDKPRKRQGSANLGDLVSLIAHVNRFKDTDSVIFADTNREHPSLTAVLDYHRTGAAGEPRFGAHRSHYAFPVSDEWTAWVAAHGKEMSQAAFAEFIEGHIVDALEPSLAGESSTTFAQKCGIAFATPSRLLELSRGLQLNVEENIVQAINLQSGEKQIQFSEKHSGQNGAPLKVPGAFLIGIPVFRADARYQVCVRLRYRKQGGALTWSMDLWRYEEVFDAAILKACDVVKDGTELPLFVGTPE